MSFCMIENRVDHIPTVELMRMLGASASRGHAEKIGCFGSGFPYSLALLARYGLLESLKVCLGTDVYTFKTEDTIVRDSKGNRNIQSEIVMRKQGGGTWNLNISTEFGALDWDDVTMALREYTSNALDGAESFDGTYQSVRIETGISEEGRNTRAKDGYIRIYMRETPAITDYLKNIRKTFICLHSGYNPNIRIMNNAGNGPARIFRKGVLVGEFGEKSLFHYNIPDIQLNESRVVHWSEARSACAKAITTSKNVDLISKFVEFLSKDDTYKSDYFEGSFSSWEYSLDYCGDDSDRAAWKEAVQRVFSGKVVCENDTTHKLVSEKGLDAVKVNSAVATLCRKYECRTADKVLNQHEIDGREIIDATDNTYEVVRAVWERIVEVGMNMGKDRPYVKGFRQNTSSSGMLGYYRLTGDTIYIRDDIMEDKGLMLRTTVLEELAHYITGAQDYTREFQDFVFKLCAISMENLK